MGLNNKGFELQFHWIFILVAGGIILAFFFMIATKQQGISQERLELTLATDIENILTGAIISKGTAQRLPVPPQGIAFECSEFCDCNFRIERAQKSFGGNAMFAPSLLKDQDITVWSLEFKTPYRVANFLYLTNPNINYIFVDMGTPQSKQLLNQLTKNIPPLISYETINAADLPAHEAGDYEHTKFIFLHAKRADISNYELSRSYRRQEYSAVNIDTTGVSFYQQYGLGFTQQDIVSYVGQPSLYAAIFAQDSTMYRCGLKTAFERLDYISQLYAERAQELQYLAFNQNRTWCNYGAPESPDADVCENSISGTIVSRLCRQHTIASELRAELDQQAITTLSVLKSQLESDNRNFIQQSCPELF